VIEYRCKDDLEALGRIPVKGEQRFTLIFPLENGAELKLHMGKESMSHFEVFIAGSHVYKSQSKGSLTTTGKEAHITEERDGAIRRKHF
jgi:hypothetical protein